MTSRMRVTAVLVGLLGLAVGLGVSGQSAQRASSDHEKAPYSRPRLKVRMENNVRIPMRDGVELSADIYRPDAEGRFPTILSRTPYSNGGPGTAAGAKFYVERGYVVVLQDTRGRHDSDGKFYPFRHEPDDGYDTDQWVGRQPWSNGRIGTMGGSYVGFTQLSQAIRGSQYLTAMVPNVTTLDIYGNWIYTGGAFQYGFALSWGANRIDGRVQQEVNPHDWPQVFRHLPILTADEALGRRSLHYRDWVRHPTRDSYWDNNSFENAHAQITVPILNITGWYDIFLVGLLKDHVEITKRAKTAVARNNKRMMIGPWVHSVGSRSNVSSERSGEKSLDFGPEAEVDVEGVQLRWFDYWLKGVDNGVGEEPPIKIFVMGENRWRYEQEWPLERTQYTRYYFRSGGHANSLYGDGTLSQEPRRGGAPSDTYTYDSSDPVPTLGGANCCYSNVVPMGPFDQRPAEWRQDVLVYTTPLLTEPVEATGPITVKLFAATSANDTDWTAKLVDVHPSGFAQNIQDGIVRARYRDSDQEAASLIQPGKVYEYTIDLWASSNAFLPGHRIRVEISSSNFPRFDRNLNTGEDPGAGTAMARATQTVYHTEEYPSHIVLPVIPRDAGSTGSKP